MLTMLNKVKGLAVGGRVLRWVAGALALCALASHAQQIRFEPQGFDSGVGDGRMWVDFNNDGKDDFCKLLGTARNSLQCYPSTGTGFGAPFSVAIEVAPRDVPKQWVDVNGDGKLDFCRILERPSFAASGVVSCRLGDAFTARITTTIPFLVTGGEDGTQPAAGLGDIRDLFFVDINTDGKTDICYLQQEPGRYYYIADMRCRISTGDGFVESSTWSRSLPDKGLTAWSRGFFDFNGDGYPDFCGMKHDYRLGCWLGGPNGFAAAEVLSSALKIPHSDKAAEFIDVNGDGKTDFCGITEVRIPYGRSFTSEYRIGCVLSNGRTWESEYFSSFIFDPGHSQARWWVDINSDGLPDYCRAIGHNPDGNEDFYDGNSHMWCRLNAGGVDGSGSLAFAPDDLKLSYVNFGRADGGRAFCDARGNGVQTFCRATRREESITPVCQDSGEGSPICTSDTAIRDGLIVGLSDATQAQPGILTTFSDGLGAETRVTYLPMTDPQVYKRSGTTAHGHLLGLPRSPIVFETRAWQISSRPETEWLPFTGSARYFYKDLLQDVRNGSRGFSERWLLSEGTNSIDHFVYFQALGPGVFPSSRLDDLREVGQVRMQERYAIQPDLVQAPADDALTARQRFLKQVMARATSLTQVPDRNPTIDSPFILRQRTTNTLGATVATTGGTGPQMRADNLWFRPVVETIGDSWDWTGTALIPLPRVEATTEIDSLGNITKTVQTTAQSATRQWKKTTTNVYAEDNRTAWLLGRLTRSTVVSTAPSAADQITPGSAGNASVASQISGTAAAVPQQQPPGATMSPATLSAILQLLLGE